LDKTQIINVFVKKKWTQNYKFEFKESLDSKNKLQEQDTHGGAGAYLFMSFLIFDFNF